MKGMRNGCTPASKIQERTPIWQTSGQRAMRLEPIIHGPQEYGRVAKSGMGHNQDSDASCGACYGGQDGFPGKVGIGRAGL